MRGSDARPANKPSRAHPTTDARASSGCAGAPLTQTHSLRGRGDRRGATAFRGRSGGPPPAGDQPAAHPARPPTPRPRPHEARSGPIRGGVGGNPPLRRRWTQTPALATTTGGEDRERAARINLAPPRSVTPHVPGLAVRGALRPVRVEAGAGGRTGFQRTRPAGRRLWRPARAAVQIPPAGHPHLGSPEQGGQSGKQQRVRNNVTSTSYERGNI